MLARFLSWLLHIHKIISVTHHLQGLFVYDYVTYDIENDHSLHPFPVTVLSFLDFLVVLMFLKDHQVFVVLLE